MFRILPTGQGGLGHSNDSGNFLLGVIPPDSEIVQAASDLGDDRLELPWVPSLSGFLGGHVIRPAGIFAGKGADVE